ncbi:hypothetical protein JCM10908_004036 [Rhodotorula pacifica]|uniref:RCC1 domain-containing protein n=1 Tax=Rhodotorula pacifica TaxID=1495444 RepID=UPI00316F3E36
MEGLQVYCAGSNSHGQLAVGDDEDRHHFTRSQLDSPTSGRYRPRRIACGANHTLLLDETSGIVFGAGGNQKGQLGAGHAVETSSTIFSPVDIAKLVNQAGVRGFSPSSYTVQDVAATWETSFFVLRPRDDAHSDILLSTGANDWGERGCPGSQSHTATRIQFDSVRRQDERDHAIRIVDLQAGPRHVVALLELIQPAHLGSPNPSTSRAHFTAHGRRVLVGWGASRQGQLGAADPDLSPPRITATPQPVVLPLPYEPAHIVSFSLGKDHTAILLDPSGRNATPAASNRAVVLLGSNKHGQLGLTRSNHATQHGLPRSRGGPSPQRVNVLGVKDLVGSSKQALRDDWALVGVHCTWSSTFCHIERSLSSEDTSQAPTSRLVAFGHNAHGQLGARSVTAPLGDEKSGLTRVPSSSTIAFPSSTAQIACGSEHVLALLETGEVLGWGWNEHGNLGLEGSIAEAADTAVLADPSSQASTIDAREDRLQDVWEPRRIWPPEGQSLATAGKAGGIAAGNATSWIVTGPGPEPALEV